MNRKPDENGGGEGGFAWQWWIATAVMLYILPFTVLMVDERLLKTYWFAHHLPEEAGKVMRAIYPFYRWFR